MRDLFSYPNLDDLVETIDRLATLLSDDEMITMAGPDAPLLEAAAMVREIGQEACDLLVVAEKHISLLDTLHLLLAKDGALSDSQQALLKKLQWEVSWYDQERERLELKLADFVRTMTVWASIDCSARPTPPPLGPGADPAADG